MTYIGNDEPGPEWPIRFVWVKETRRERFIRRAMTVPRWAALAILWTTWRWYRIGFLLTVTALLVLTLWR